MKSTLRLLPLALFIFANRANAQDTINEKNLDEVIIYSGKFAERKKNVVQKIDIITARNIAQANTQSTGDLLASTGNVFVQKSQQGGSSPVIRGFEASRVLLVIDGIRMNNAIYRAGHLQNIITVDQNMLERIEVLYGPASTLYGSDALGGVVHMRTKQPQLSTTADLKYTGTAFARYSSANHEKTAHADLSIAGAKFGWLQSYNFSDFDDLRMGDNYPDKYPDFGRRTQYVTSINGQDSIVQNEDDRIQKFSGYHQWDITQKFLYRPSSKYSHALNLQFSRSGDIPRYDRLQDKRNGRLRFAEWYYGPQERTMGAYEMNVNSTGFFQAIRSIVSYQRIKESRHQREYRKGGLQNRFEALDVISLIVDARKIKNNHEITVGTDAQFNGVRSTAYNKNIITGATSPLDTRYFNGSNRMNYYGLYAQHLLKFGNGKFVLNDGLRLQAVSLDATIRDTTIMKLPFTEIRQDNIAVTGNAGIVYSPTKNTRLTLGLSSGFRAPNIDDASKVFESGNNQLIIPNENLKPEYTYNSDLGIQHIISGIARLELTAFYTYFTNAIALAPTQLNGSDSAFYNGANVKVYSNQNVNEARLYGFSGNATIDLEHFRFYSTLSYTKGRLQTADKTELPLDHIPPVFGKTSVSYSNKKITAELSALYNGWKRIEDYNPFGEDNLQYATPEGMPSWITLNLKASYQLHKRVQLQAGMENILDRNYRHFASGFSSPGRNMYLAMRVNY